MEKQFRKLSISSIDPSPKGGIYVTKKKLQKTILKKFIFLFILLAAIICLFRKKSY